MNWTEALEALAGHPHAHRYRELCREDNPDRAQRDGYRQRVIRLAEDTPSPPLPVRVPGAGRRVPIRVDYSIVHTRPCGTCS